MGNEVEREIINNTMREQTDKSRTWDGLLLQHINSLLKKRKEGEGYSSLNKCKR